MGKKQHLSPHILFSWCNFGTKLFSTIFLVVSNFWCKILTEKEVWYGLLWTKQHGMGSYKCTKEHGVHNFHHKCPARQTHFVEDWMVWMIRFCHHRCHSCSMNQRVVDSGSNWKGEQVTCAHYKPCSSYWTLVLNENSVSNTLFIVSFAWIQIIKELDTSSMFGNLCVVFNFKETISWG